MYRRRGGRIKGEGFENGEVLDVMYLRVDGLVRAMVFGGIVFA